MFKQKIKKFTCEICFLSYRYKRNLIRHKNIHHQINCANDNSENKNDKSGNSIPNLVRNVVNFLSRVMYHVKIVKE